MGYQFFGFTADSFEEFVRTVAQLLTGEVENSVA